MSDYCIYKLFINNAYNFAGGLLVSTSSVLPFSTIDATFKNAKLKLYIYIKRQILLPKICLSLLSWLFSVANAIMDLCQCS